MQKTLRTLVRPSLLGACMLLAVFALNLNGTGITSSHAQSAGAPHGKTTGVPEKKPDGTWEGLGPAQQKILAPLEDDWNFMLPESRKKWIQVANLYPKISEADQRRLQSRMASWSSLSQKDRRIARENYLSSLKFPAEKKVEAWSAYQKLSDEEKKRLAQAEEVKKKPTAANAPTMQQHPVNPTPTSQLPPRVPKGITPEETIVSPPSTSGSADSPPPNN